MINPVSSAHNPPATSAAAPKTPPAPAKNPPQDTVQLSSKATGADADHDGDSH
jgi:hypothetical protein